MQVLQYLQVNSTQKGSLAVKMWLGQGAWSPVPGLTQFQLASSVHPGKRQVTATVTGFLPPMWESWVEFPVPCFSRAEQVERTSLSASPSGSKNIKLNSRQLSFREKHVGIRLSLVKQAGYYSNMKKLNLLISLTS